LKKIKAMIAEDERLARDELAYLLGKESDFELLPSAANGRELLELVPEWNPDVVFLDIQMPELKGIDTARLLRKTTNPPLFVFTTAHEEYAVEAFSLNAVDYLLKPYDWMRLQETILRVRRKLAEQGSASAGSAAAAVPEEPRKPVSSAGGRWNKLLIEDGEKHVLIDPQSIVFAVREEKTVDIVTKANQRFATKSTLQELEEKLGHYSFFRAHRSYLVNLDMIDELVPWFNGAYNLVLKDAKRTQIPLSRTAAKELFKLLKGE